MFTTISIMLFSMTIKSFRGCWDRQGKSKWCSHALFQNNFMTNICNQGKFSSDLADRWVEAMLKRYEAVWQKPLVLLISEKKKSPSQLDTVNKDSYNSLSQCFKSKVYDQSLLQPSHCWEFYKLSTAFSTHGVFIKHHVLMYFCKSSHDPLLNFLK